MKHKNLNYLMDLIKKEFPFYLKSTLRNKLPINSNQHLEMKKKKRAFRQKSQEVEL